MARLSDQLIDRIKKDVSLVRLVEAKGFTLKAHGKGYVMCCPFHQDETASLVINPSENLWHCMGACQCGGSVIDWVMKTEGVSFRHAVELLQNRFLPLTADTNEAPKVLKQASTPKLAPPLTADADTQTALRQVIDYYHATLKQAPEALAYLESRGLKHPELIDTFKLGYANRTLGYRLPQKNRQAGAELRGKLQDIGLIRESGHEHFNGSIVVPVCDENGLITEVYGRKVLGERLRSGTAIHTYLPGPHRGVWNLPALKASQEIILCEALFDAMSFWCAGFRNVTASYGVSGFTADHLEAFKQYGIERVYIAYDRDEAGNVAAEKLAKQLMAEGIACFRVLFPKGMDANEYARQVQPADKSLGVALRTAEWMGNGKRPQAPEIERMKTENGAVLSTVADATETVENKTAVKSEKPPEPLPASAIAPGMALPPASLQSLTAVPATAARPVPAFGTVEVPVEASAHEVLMTLEERHYRIRGLSKNLSYEQLKINLMIRVEERFHVDTFDIYCARHRAAYIKQAGQELGLSEDVIKRDLGKVLLKLEGLQDQQIKGVLTQKSKTPVMSDQELREALALLKTPMLLDQIVQDFNRCGVVGEETNKLVGYLAAVSRKLEKPLAVMVQSSSAAGKSSLMEAVLAFMPEEERIQYSAMTGQSLFYMGEQDLKHKILAIAEEEGANTTSYALKLLQSEGVVSIASTGKNAVTGNLETQEYRVEGPVMLFSTTTAIDIDEELMNRCLVLSVDESRAQTQAIHAAQRRKRTLEGLKAKKDKDTLLRLHQNAQRLLRPLAVMNPYADQLTFLDDKTRTRRDHEKYLGLIDVITLLHQYQRKIQRETHAGEVIDYIEVTLDDIVVANRLAHEVLGRTLDELPPQTRKLLEMLDDMVQEACTREGLTCSDYRFSRKAVREYCGWGNTQLKIHLKRLEEMEYLIVHRGKRGQTFDYELLYQGEGTAQTSFLMGLIDPRKLKDDGKKSGGETHKAGLGRPSVGGESARGRSTENAENAGNKAPNANLPENTEKSTPYEKINGASYRTETLPVLTAGLSNAITVGVEG